MPAPYSAGSIFLQVVPSFRGVPEAIAREARDWGDDAGRKFDENFEKQATASAKRTGQKVGQALEAEGGKAGERAGKAYGGHFETAVKNAVARTTREVGTIKIDADDKLAQAKFRQLKRDLDALSGKADIGMDLKVGTVMAKLAAVEEGLREIQDRAKSIDARVNSATALAEVAKVRAELMALSAIQIEPEIKIDRQVGAFERSLKGAIEGAIRDLGEVDLDRHLKFGDNLGARAVAEIRRQLHELDGMRIGVDITAETARERLQLIRDDLQRLQQEHWGIDLDANTAAAEANLATFLAVLEEVDGQTATVDIDVKDAVSAITLLEGIERHGMGASRSLDEVTASGRRASGMGQDGANSFRAFNAMVLGVASLGPLVVPALGGIAAGIGGLLPMAAAGAAGLGVLALGLYGVGDAFKAMGAARDSSTKDMATWSKGVETASRQVRNAQESLASARQSAARSEEDSARRVQDALRGVRDAERNLGDAQKQVKQAQEDLTKARKEATEQLEDLQLRARDSVLDERQAVLDLREAEADLAKARQEGVKGDALERLVLAYDRAQFRLDSVREAQGDLNEEQAKWARTGVEGSDKVVAAQDRLVQAQRGVEDASRRVAEAQQAVSDARRDQARAAEDANRQILHAQEAVNDAMENYANALGKTSSAQDKLRQSMENLGPAGRSFVTWLDSMRPRFRELRGLAQAGFLPGLQNWIDSIINGRGPLLESTVRRISGALGDMFSSFAVSLRGDDFSRLFEMIDRSGPRFIGYMSQILVNLGEGIASLIAAMEPLGDLFGGWFVKLTAAFRDWARSLQGSDGLRDFFEWIQRIGPKIADLIHELFRALVNLAVALAPYAEGLMGVLTGILRWIGDMDPTTLRNLAVGILGVTAALQGLFGATALFKSAQSAWHILKQIGDTLGGIGKVIGWVPVLIAGLVILYEKSDAFRAVADKLWKEVLQPLAEFFAAILMPILDALVSLLGDHIELVAGAAVAWSSWKILEQVITWVNALKTSLIGLTIAQAAAGLGMGAGARGIMSRPGNVAAGLGAGAAAGGLGAAAGAGAIVGLGIYAARQSTNSDQDAWVQALMRGGSAAAKAREEMADPSFWDRAVYNMGHWFNTQDVGERQTRETTAALQEQYDSMTNLEKAQTKVAEWTATLEYRQKSGTATTEELAAAHRRLDYWTEELARLQGEATDSTDKLTEAMVGQQNAAIALADAEYAYTRAKQDLNSAYAEYVRVQADANATDEQRRAAEEAWTNQARQTAEAARNAAIARHADADAATQQAFGNAALLADLERQKEVYGQLPPYLEELRASLAATVDPATLAAAKMELLGIKVLGIPDQKSITISSTTPEQLALLEQLGFSVETLPDGTVKVTALTDEAQAALDELTKTRTMNIVATVTPARHAQEGEWAAFGGNVGRNARGGFIRGPGTGTSDSILSWLSNGEFVVRAASVAKYGLGLLDAINRGEYPADGYARGGRVQRRPEKAWLPAYADGGYVANWGGTVGLSGLAVPELATFWVQAVSTITTASGIAADSISRIFLSLRNAVLGNFGDTGAQLTASWLGTIGNLVGTSRQGHDGILGIFGSLRDGSNSIWTQLRDLLFGRASETRDQQNTIFTQLRDLLFGRGSETRDNAHGLWIQLRDLLFGRGSETRDQQNSIFTQLRDGVIRTVVDAVSRMGSIWGLIPNNLIGPVNTLIDRVLNNGLFRAFNAIVGALGLDVKLNIPLQAPARLAAGGRVPGWSPNDKADNIPAMLTAGEYVHPVDAVDYYGPEFMEAIRKKKIPRGILGYATGGWVAMQNVIMRQFPWARITSGFRPGDPGYHGRGQAIDIGGAAAYPNPEAIRQMLAINRWIASNFSNITELIHTAPGAINLWHGAPHKYNAATQAEHRNHVHWAMAGGLTPGSSILGALANMLGVGMDLISDPAGFLRKAVDNALGNFDGDGSSTKKIMAAGVRKATGWVIDKVTGFLGSMFGFGDGDFASGAGGPVVDQVRAVAARYGWDKGAEWSALDWLINKESGWRLNAANPRSSARGLFQKMTSIHGPVEPTATGQAQWGLNYIKTRHGSPTRAKAFHLSHGWYREGGPVQDVDSATGGIVPDLHDTGGWLMPGLNVLMNRTGRPEPVINPQTLDALLTIADGGSATGTPAIGTLVQNLYDGPTAREIAGAVDHAATVARRGGKY